MREILPSLKRQCERFKTERASLQTEIASLRSERDTLRLEVQDGHDLHAVVEEHLLTDVDGQGRANRRIWLLEQRNADLDREVATSRYEHAEAIEKERNVSQGLRERIGALEKKRRRAEDETEEAKKRETELKAEIQALREAAGQAPQTSQGREEKARPAQVAAEVARCVSANLPVIEAQAITDRYSPRRALSKRSSNVALFMPITPVKSQKTPTAPAQPSSTVKTPTRSRATSLSPGSMTKRYAALEDRHKILKAEYDRLRSKYQDDIKHWKDWKALDTARKEEKRKRKEQKQQGSGRTANNTPAAAVVQPLNQADLDDDDAMPPEEVSLVPLSQDSPSSSRPTASQDQPGSQRVTRSQARKRKADEERAPSQPEPLPAQQDVRDSHLGQDGDAAERLPAPPVEITPMPPPSQKRRPTREERETRDDTPTPGARGPGATTSEMKKRATPAARITPWLGSGPGGKTRTSASTARHEVDPFDIDAHDREPSPLKRYPSSASYHDNGRTPLVRDRGEGPASSLRRAALTRTFSTDLAAIDTSRNRDSVSPDTESSAVKRRRLDMEGLSPAEKAQERKRLNKMTPAQRRAEYADYKGKGRYLPPDEV